jgi:threonine dehydratase
LIPLEKIRGARETIAGAAIRTPLVRLHAPEAPAEIYLKLENLQPIGSFKIRGATNAIRRALPEATARGVVTASAGNMAQGVAWAARELGVPATIVVPEHAPETKLAAIERLGGTIVKVSFERWWQVIDEARYDEAEGLFVHPVSDDLVMAGNGTIGLEILEDLPDPDVVLVPYGGGGLTAGIASAMKALAPGVRVCPVEPETAAPLAASLAAGEAREAEFTLSFVDGSGSPRLLPKMWELVRPLIAGSFTASLDEVAGAIRLLAERVRVIAEGAGALAPAVALSGRAGKGKVVAVVSGGNIDLSRLMTILGGETPSN